MQEKSSTNIHFIEVVGRLKVERDLSDEGVAKLLNVGGTYISQIRTGHRNASDKLLLKAESILAKSRGDDLMEMIPASEGFREQVRRWAAEAGESVPHFVEECLRRHGPTTARALKRLYEVRLASSSQGADAQAVAKKAGEAF